MEVGRVLQRDAVQREVVGVVGDDQARDLLAAAGARLLGKVPPGILRAQHFFAAAAVDDAVAHDAGVGRVIDGDEGLAAAGTWGMADDAATARRNGKDGRIARGEEGDALADDERDVGLQLERAAEEGVVGLVDAEQHGAPRAAFVYCPLNARAVSSFCSSAGGERMAVRRKLRVDRDAKLRE